MMNKPALSGSEFVPSATPKPRSGERVPRDLRKTFLGECYKDKEYIGDLHRADGGCQVLRIEYGKVLSESPVLPSTAFRRAGGMQLSASQFVWRYEQIQ